MRALKKVKYACILVIALTFLLSPAVSFCEPIKIGAMFISSGPMGGYGKHGRQAIQLAVDQINADGGVLGHNVEAIVEDSKLKKDVAMALAERFVIQDKVDFSHGTHLQRHRHGVDRICPGEQKNSGPHPGRD